MFKMSLFYSLSGTKKILVSSSAFRKAIPLHLHLQTLNYSLICIHETIIFIFLTIASPRFPVHSLHCDVFISFSFTSSSRDQLIHNYGHLISYKIYVNSLIAPSRDQYSGPADRRSLARWKGDLIIDSQTDLQSDPWLNTSLVNLMSTLPTFFSAHPGKSRHWLRLRDEFFDSLSSGGSSLSSLSSSAGYFE